MRAQSVTVSGVAASDALLLNPNSVGPYASILLDMGAGCTATVQVTLDDPADAGAVWVSAPVAALVGATTDLVASLGVAARAVRLNQTVGAPASTMKVLSPGIV